MGVGRVGEEVAFLAFGDKFARPVQTRCNDRQPAAERLQDDEATRVVKGRLDVDVRGGVVGDRVVDGAGEGHERTEPPAPGRPAVAARMLAPDDQQPRGESAAAPIAQRPQQRRHALEFEIVGDDQKHEFRRGRCPAGREPPRGTRDRRSGWNRSVSTPL